MLRLVTLNAKHGYFVSTDLKSMSSEELARLKHQLRSVVAQSRDLIPQVCKRKNRNHPREVSSKFRERPQRTKIVRRDPRFEEECGSFNEKQFQEDYKFLEDLREQEMKALKKKLKKEDDPKEKLKLFKVKASLENQEREAVNRKKEKEIIDKLKKEAEEKTGKPWIKQSDIKAAKYVEKFQALKKSGKLQKYLERKRKKNVVRDRNKTPFS